MYSFLPKSTPRFHIDPFHFEKKSGFQLATEKSTALWIPFLITGMELYEVIFRKPLSLRLAGTAQIHLADDIGIPPQKTNIEQKILSFFGPKL